MEAIMTGTSTLDPDNFPQAPDRTMGRGHGTGALGPSDSSDSGSDVAGGTAGPELGDADLDSDTDSRGTGERAEVGRESVEKDGADINVDHIETVPLADLEGDEDSSAGERR
jgi:hypothetical protein